MEAQKFNTIKRFLGTGTGLFLHKVDIYYMFRLAFGQIAAYHWAGTIRTYVHWIYQYWIMQPT